jgi:hypothetical protein
VLSSAPTCAPFEEEGERGFIRAEGYGTLVLKRLSDAERDGDRSADITLSTVPHVMRYRLGSAYISLEGDIKHRIRDPGAQAPERRREGGGQVSRHRAIDLVPHTLPVGGHTIFAKVVCCGTFAKKLPLCRF